MGLEEAGVRVVGPLDSDGDALLSHKTWHQAPPSPQSPIDLTRDSQEVAAAVCGEQIEECIYMQRTMRELAEDEAQMRKLRDMGVNMVVGGTPCVHFTGLNSTREVTY